MAQLEETIERDRRRREDNERALERVRERLAGMLAASDRRLGLSAPAAPSVADQGARQQQQQQRRRQRRGEPLSLSNTLLLRADRGAHVSFDGAA